MVLNVCTFEEAAAELQFDVRLLPLHTTALLTVQKAQLHTAAMQA